MEQCITDSRWVGVGTLTCRRQAPPRIARRSCLIGWRLRCRGSVNTGRMKCLLLMLLSVPLGSRTLTQWRKTIILRLRLRWRWLCRRGGLVVVRMVRLGRVVRLRWVRQIIRVFSRNRKGLGLRLPRLVGMSRWCHRRTRVLSGFLCRGARFVRRIVIRGVRLSLILLWLKSLASRG